MANVEKRLSERDGKPVILFLVRNKPIAAKPEEIVRHLWLEHLIRYYKYDVRRLAVCVCALEEWKLFNSNLDVIDDAFEYLVGQSAKGQKGQYFTPRWVIDMCVKMLNPADRETLIDTAAGSTSMENFLRAA